MIEFNNVTKQYANGQVGLRNISLKIPLNQLVFITGHTGAGKTTAVKLMTLRHVPTAGQVIVSDTNLSELSRRNRSRYRRKIGAVFQDLPLLSDRSVSDNVAMPLLVDHSAPAKILPLVTTALETVGLRSKMDFKPTQLADGEIRRVNIARAIVHQPQLLIADEPTANMDPTQSTKVLNLFKRLAARKTTVVVATHDRDFFFDRRYPVIELREGQLADAMRR